MPGENASNVLVGYLPWPPHCALHDCASDDAGGLPARPTPTPQRRRPGRAQRACEHGRPRPCEGLDGKNGVVPSAGQAIAQREDRRRYRGR